MVAPIDSRMTNEQQERADRIARKKAVVERRKRLAERRNKETSTLTVDASISGSSVQESPSPASTTVSGSPSVSAKSSASETSVSTGERLKRANETLSNNKKAPLGLYERAKDAIDYEVNVSKLLVTGTTETFNKTASAITGDFGNSFRFFGTIKFLFAISLLQATGHEFTRASYSSIRAREDGLIGAIVTSNTMNKNLKVFKSSVLIMLPVMLPLFLINGVRRFLQPFSSFGAKIWKNRDTNSAWSFIWRGVVAGVLCSVNFGLSLLSTAITAISNFIIAPIVHIAASGLDSLLGISQESSTALQIGKTILAVIVFPGALVVAATKFLVVDSIKWIANKVYNRMVKFGDSPKNEQGEAYGLQEFCQQTRAYIIDRYQAQKNREISADEYQKNLQDCVQKYDAYLDSLVKKQNEGKISKDEQSILKAGLRGMLTRVEGSLLAKAGLYVTLGRVGVALEGAIIDYKAKKRDEFSCDVAGASVSPRYEASLFEKCFGRKPRAMSSTNETDIAAESTPFVGHARGRSSSEPSVTELKSGNAQSFADLDNDNDERDSSVRMTR